LKLPEKYFGGAYTLCILLGRVYTKCIYFEITRKIFWELLEYTQSVYTLKLPEKYFGELLEYTRHAYIWIGHTRL